MSKAEISIKLCLPKEFSSCYKPQQIFCWDRITFCIVFGLRGKSYPTLVFLSPAHRTASPSSALAPTGFILVCLGWILSPSTAFFQLVHPLGTWPHTLQAFLCVQGRDSQAGHRWHPWWPLRDAAGGETCTAGCSKVEESCCSQPHLLAPVLERVRDSLRQESSPCLSLRESPAPFWGDIGRTNHSFNLCAGRLNVKFRLNKPCNETS